MEGRVGFYVSVVILDKEDKEVHCNAAGSCTCQDLQDGNWEPLHVEFGAACDEIKEKLKKYPGYKIIGFDIFKDDQFIASF